ncbi:uncharacterized protein CANTADRAFT_8415 [Suhomyces tanzawaensis NRRL Y-17324]|uniref:Uncharacterized protein n=1 Tax=Suhomyces tanzawaensis NRRL Y-17324 TaxID=984487 RepID=A0A1E4SBH7_9ASCO|nr:uncharacterized protein CANTADRAFT_8415 [Suhomyces tanzawaensis NRRL Y-17324]ODV76828.1 hypothetical protein CANTADRAFT_8415 [Suhomyces tanzawaensis NRRL Y-17324]
MSKFTEKINQLKEESDHKQSAYYQLKTVYTTKQDELTQKEYQLRALTAQNTFLTERLARHNSQHQENSDQLAKNQEAIAGHQNRIDTLTRDITELETRYDETVAKLSEVQAELHDIHQALS